MVLRAGARLIEGTFGALADPSRRGVVELLRRTPRRAGDLAQALDLSPPAMSRHLRVLRQSGLIEAITDDADARAKVYRLKREKFTELRAWLDDVEQLWTVQLSAFKAYSERKKR